MGIIIIRCANCKKKICVYYKVGKGKLHRCWKKRIVENHTITRSGEVFCKCGNLIGYDRGGYIKLKPGSFKISGRKW